VKDDEQIDRSLIRLYLLYRASIEACLIDDAVSELRGRRTTISRASVAQLLRGLQNKDYVSLVKDSGGRKMFRATARGRRSVQQLRTCLRLYV
jgi:DNA-binding PadR family transcriptional regulator